MHAQLQPVITIDIQRALRKGRLRRGILLLLADEHELTIEQIAEKLRSEREHVVWAIQGHGKAFRESFALLTLGLVRWLPGPAGFSLELTPLGELVAARLMVGWQP